MARGPNRAPLERQARLLDERDAIPSKDIQPRTGELQSESLESQELANSTLVLTHGHLVNRVGVERLIRMKSG